MDSKVPYELLWLYNKKKKSENFMLKTELAGF